MAQNSTPSKKKKMGKSIGMLQSDWGNCDWFINLLESTFTDEMLSGMLRCVFSYKFSELGEVTPLSFSEEKCPSGVCSMTETFNAFVSSMMGLNASAEHLEKLRWGSTTRPSPMSCTCVSAIPGYQLRMNRGRAALPRRTWGCWWRRGWMWAGTEHSAQKVHCALGCMKRGVETLECCIQLLHPQHRKDMDLLEPTMKMVKGMKCPSYEDKLWELGLLRLEKRSLWEEPYCSLSIPKCAYKNDEDRFFSWTFAIRQGVMALN